MTNFSLKMRLMSVFSVFFVFMGVCCGIVSWFEAKETIDEFFDTYQMALARNLASADWTHINNEIQKYTNFELQNIKHSDEDDEAIGFAVFDLNGNMVFHDNENGKDFVFQSVTGAFLNENVDGEPWRIIRVKSADKNFIVAIGQELEYRSDVAWDLIEEFMLPWLIGFGILLIFMLLIVEREFKPLKHAAKLIKQRNIDDLSEVSVNGVPREVLPLVDAINELLKKLELLLQQERRFVADAAHELRTPLTALSVQLEVLQMEIDNKKNRDKAVNNLEQGLVRASHLVEQLLLLSKIENSLVVDTYEQELIDWKKLVFSVCDEYKIGAQQKSISFEIKKLTTKGPIDKANKTLISIVVKNLVENAVKYSTENAIVRIETSADYLKVFNSGINVKNEHITYLGQRFYRPSGHNEKGSGLGLSIVKLITKYYGCKLKFSNIDDGFEVVIVKD